MTRSILSFSPFSYCLALFASTYAVLQNPSKPGFARVVGVFREVEVCIVWKIVLMSFVTYISRISGAKVAVGIGGNDP